MEGLSVSEFFKISTVVFLAALAGIVFYQMVTGKINMNGLLSNKQTQEFSPERLQMLILTLVVAFYYLGQAKALGFQKFPEVDNYLLTLLAGSHGLYLGSKAIRETGSS